MSLEDLEASCLQCQRCDLAKERKHVVVSRGHPSARLMVIGEAPGAEEDQRGEPFVGKAGQLLDVMLSSIHLSRDKVYIANILKCRPPNNRDPKPKESLTCGPYLERQISLLQPKVILALGRISAQWLLKSDSPIGRLRGGEFNYGERQIPLVVSYHPAYLLRSPSAKSKAWEDLVLVMQVLQNS